MDFNVALAMFKKYGRDTYPRRVDGVLTIGDTPVSPSEVGAIPTLQKLHIPASVFTVVDGIIPPTFTHIDGTPTLKFPRNVHIVDNFTRANSTTTPGALTSGQSWVVEAGTWGIINNALYNVSAQAGSRIRVDGTPVDGQVSAIFSTLPGTGEFLVRYRVTDANNYVYVSVTSTGSVRVGHRVAGTQTQLAGLGGAYTAGSTVTLRAIGTTLSVYVNGVLLPSLTVTTTITGGTAAGLNTGEDATGTARLSKFWLGQDGTASAVVALPAHWTTFDVSGYFTNLGAGSGYAGWKYSECAWDMSSTSLAVIPVSEFSYQSPARGGKTPLPLGVGRPIPASRVITVNIGRINSHTDDTTNSDLGFLELVLAQNT